MNRITTILLTLATIAASTSATRADELSELVAAVAATMQQQRMDKDVKTVFPDNGKTHYQPKKKATNLDTSMLDGIFTSMKRESLRRMRRDAYDEDDGFGRYNDGYIPPTLGRTDFYRPVPGIITSHFGWRPKFQRMHHGVDLRLQIGDTVRAAVSGTVEKIDYDHNGYGHYVVMAHPDGMETVYGHMMYALVAQGQFVYAGQPVGIGGNTGNSTGPHLHFETRLGGTAVDPTLIFDFYGYQPLMAETREEPAAKMPRYSHQSKSLKKEATYIVRYGDTLQSIASQAGMTVMRLCQLNMLNQTDPLTVGRMLKLK